MKQLLPFFVLVLQASLGQAAELKTPGDRMFADYFKIETKRLADDCLAEIQVLEDWNVKKQVYRKQLHEMLGLDPMPERTACTSLATCMCRRTSTSRLRRSFTFAATAE